MTAGRCECKVEAHAGPCPNALAEPKFVRCRPCAKGWHRRAPCTDYEPEPYPQHVSTCERCGFARVQH